MTHRVVRSYPLSHWRIDIGVVIAGACAFLQLYAPQPLLAVLREQFNASEMWVSLTISVATGAVALSAPFLAAIADTIGRKRVIVPCLIILALSTLGCSLATSLNELIFWRFVGGVFTPGVIAVTLAYIAEESPARAATTTSLYIAGTVLGGLTGRLTTAFVADASSWRASFVVLAGLSSVGVLLVWWILPRSRNFRRPDSAAAMLGAMGSHLGNPSLLATYLVGFVVLFCHVGLFTYASFYLSAAPFSLTTAQLGLIFLVYALGLIITPLSGQVIHRFGYRAGMVVAALLVSCGMLLTLSHWLTVFIAGIALASSGIFVAQASASSHVGRVALEARSAASGLYVSAYYLGGCVGALALAGPWRYAGWTGIVIGVLAMQCLLVGVAWRFFARSPRPTTPPTEALSAA